MRLRAASRSASLDADVTATPATADGVALSRPFDAALAGDHCHPRPSRRIASQALRSMGGMIMLAWRRHQTRKALCELDGHLLGDIGITRGVAEHEANKPFWQA